MVRAASLAAIAVPVQAVPAAADLRAVKLQADAVPATALPVRVGIVEFVRPNPNEPVLDATTHALVEAFGRDNVHVAYYSLFGLEEAVRKGEVDIFIASAGFYIRMTPWGVRSLATVVSRNYPNPNGNDGTLMLVRRDRKDLVSLEDLRGKRLATSTPYAFTGLQVPNREIFAAGYDPDDFFKHIRFLGDDDKMIGAFDLLEDGEVDAAFFRLCLFEALEKKSPERAARFRVLNEQTEPGEACRRSTRLYPSWTAGSTPSADPRISRLVTRVLLQMSPAGEPGLYWGVATNYSEVDALFRDLRLGPYAYLRSWTIRRLFDEYGTYVGFIGLFVCGLLLHVMRTSRLVRIRTAELAQALEREKHLKHEAQAANDRLSRIEKASAVGQLSTIFAHEMRQPLGAISLYAFGLKKRVDAGQYDQGVFAKTLAKLVDQAARASQIVERVRTYAKSDAVKTTTLDLTEAVKRAIDNLRVTGRAQADIAFEPPQGSVSVTFDALDLELVILNLVKNALDAVKPLAEAGRVTIRILNNGAREAVLEIADNGLPLSEEGFAALSALRPSQKSEGLGLGLAIVRSILERHSGRLTFSRCETGGLIVCVYLPLAGGDADRDGVEQSKA